MATRRPRLRAAASPHSSPPLSNASISIFAGLKSSVQRRLLVPTRCPAPETAAQPIKAKPRSRADSASPEALPKDERRWFNVDCRFEVVEEAVQLSGYQIFAVEKWIVERTRTTTLLSVYTGDPKDKITVTALAPASSLSTNEAHKEWEKVIHDLRKDGARPRETDKGIIMVTSLANFRSDYTVVYIPEGRFIAHREQLYVNINLMRMGCSGRSALTLQEPSDTTKDRFISMYYFNDNIRLQERFRKTVLELVRLIQCGLSLYDMFPVDVEERNGLLCDITVYGIQKWVAEIGEPYLRVEPMERIADPSTVAAIISLILSMCNKLSVIGCQTVPKDPFLHPRRFTRSLAAFVNQRLNQSSASSPATGPTMCHHAYLNLTLIKHIDLAYDKYRSSDAYKLHRVVLNKLDDITAATTSAMTSSKGIRHGKSLSLSLSSKDRDAESLLESTSDLAGFVGKVGQLRGKDCGSSLRYLWMGRLDQLDRKRWEGVWSDAEDVREKERERERSESDEEGDLLSVFPWSGKVQKKIESWAGEFGRNKLKKSSVDLSMSTREKSPESLQNAPMNTGAVPSVVISRCPDEPVSGLSSGQISPISPSASLYALGGFSSAHTSALGIGEDEYYQRLAQFNRKWPRRMRMASWSDTVSAEALAKELDLDMETTRAADFPVSGHGLVPHTSSYIGSSVGSTESNTKARKRVQPFLLKRKRSYSFDDHVFMDHGEILSAGRMQVDVDLCAQSIIMHRRKFHIKAILASLQALVQTTSVSNDTLLKYLEEHTGLIQDLTAKCQIAADIEEAVSAADSALADTDALLYEANFLDVHGLWRMAQGPRLRVFAIRDRVFGVRGRRQPAESHGRFNRVQRLLDERERLVDFLGRTESDIEEECELPEDVHIEGEGDSEDEDTGERLSRKAAEESQLQALSSWLLTLFTKWGRVLGVSGAAASTPAVTPTEAVTVAQAEPKNDRSGTLSNVPLPSKRVMVAGNGHSHRLSTVGEEEEPSDAVSIDSPLNQGFVKNPATEQTS